MCHTVAAVDVRWLSALYVALGSIVGALLRDALALAALPPFNAVLSNALACTLLGAWHAGGCVNARWVFPRCCFFVSNNF